MMKKSEGQEREGWRNKVLRVCLDPGHGLSNRTRGVYDPGAVGGGIAEADVALSWALAAKFYLLKAGIEVVMTRDSAEDDCRLVDRAWIAGDVKADMLISFHCNSSSNPLVQGTETIFDKDRILADMVQTCALTALGSKNRGLKTESQLGRGKGFNLKVLDFEHSCLLELDFISNPLRRRALLDRSCRAVFGQALAARLGRLGSLAR